MQWDYRNGACTQVVLCKDSSGGWLRIWKDVEIYMGECRLGGGVEKWVALKPLVNPSASGGGGVG